MHFNRALWVFQTGNTVPKVREQFGDFDSHFQSAIGSTWPGVWRVIDVRDESIPLPSRFEIAGVIITGSASSVTERAPWMLRLEETLREFVHAEIPMLGVCFGHQIVASAMGSKVQRNPAGRRMGTQLVHRVDESNPDPLFDGIPSRFHVNVSHQDHVAEFSTCMGDSAQILAKASHDQVHAFAIGRNARGVQFHPEFHGSIIRGYIETRQEILKQEGFEPTVLLKEARDTPEGGTILRNFVQHFVMNQSY